MQVSKKNRNTALFNFFFFITIFLIGFGFIEIVLRTTHLFEAKVSWTKPDPVIGWRNVPGSIFWQYKENDHPITGTINSHGWRDKERTLEKKPNTFRIALLGDSFVEALQVEDDRTFSRMTEKALNSNRKLKLEILNFGQSGFTQTEELIILKNDVIKFSPNMVILFFFPGNDIDDIRRQTASNIFHPYYHLDENGELLLDTSFSKLFSYKVKSFVSPFKQYSVIVSLISERVNLYLQLRQNNNKDMQPDSDATRLSGHLSLATANPDTVYLTNYKLNKFLIKTIAEFCKQNDIRFMLATINLQKTYQPEVEEAYKSIDPTFNIYFFEDDLKEYASSLGIDYIGLQSIFRKQYTMTGESLQWGHWNYRGHEVVADALTGKLESILSGHE